MQGTPGRLPFVAAPWQGDEWNFFNLMMEKSLSTAGKINPSVFVENWNAYVSKMEGGSVPWLNIRRMTTPGFQLFDAYIKQRGNELATLAPHQSRLSALHNTLAAG